MAIFMFLSGAALILIIMVDVIWTTLTTRGAGALSRGLVAALRRLFLALYRGSESRRCLVYAGPVSIVVLGGTWVSGLWTGWVLVFLSMPGSVVDSSTSIPTDLNGYIYFSGYTLSSLGIGDLVPSGAVPRLLTALASFNGLVLVTLVITYAVPLVSAAVERRKLAFGISLMGDSPAEIRANFADAPTFGDWLAELRPDLLQCTEQRMAYPVLDLFFSRYRRFSLAPQLANLCLATSLLQEQEQNIGFQRELAAFHKVVERYMELVETRGSTFEQRLERLKSREGWTD